tara:strand:- start:95 stop:349 length:255 start_codon:yes stop_codon:yes gene_type:complete
MNNPKDQEKKPAVCECHKIDWTGGPGKYKYIDTGQLLCPQRIVDCGDKVNEGLMEIHEYDLICQYIPGEEGSKFPQDVYKKLVS